MGLALTDCGGIEATAGLDEVLMNAVPLGGDEPLVGVPGTERSTGEANLVDLLHGRGHRHQQIDLVGKGHVERRLGVGSLVLRLHHRYVGQRSGLARHRRRCLGDLGGAGSGGAQRLRREVVGSEEAPRRPDQRPHADSGRFVAVELLHRTIEHFDLLVAGLDVPGIGIGGPRGERRLDRSLGVIEHGRQP